MKSYEEKRFNNANIYFIISLLILPIKSFVTNPIPHHTLTRSKLSSLAYQDERHISTTATNIQRKRRNAPNSLEQRLRDMYKQDQQKRSERRHSVVKVVHTMDEFKDVIQNEGKDKIIITRFFANWCKVCILPIIITTLLMYKPTGMQSNNTILLFPSKQTHQYTIPRRTPNK